MRRADTAAASHSSTAPTPRFAVEAVEKCGPNVMVWQVVTGEKRWYIVGDYIAPADEGTMELVVKAIRQRLSGAELLVAGDLNANILAPE